MAALRQLGPWVALAALGGAPGASAGEPEEKAKHLCIRSTGIASSPYASERGLGSDFLDYGSVLGFVEKKADGKLAAGSITIYYTPLGPDRKPVGPKRGVWYSEFRKGDLVPVFRHVYRVTKLTLGPGPAGTPGHEVELEWVPDDQLPAGLAVGADPILVPLKGTNGVRDVALEVTHSYVLTLMSVDRAEEGKGPAFGVLDILPPSPPRSPVSAPRHTATVRAGDALLIGASGYKVRNVVPRDDKTKAIGWVELAPDAVPKADLERDKVRIVVPEVVKEPPTEKK